MPLIRKAVTFAFCQTASCRREQSRSWCRSALLARSLGQNGGRRSRHRTDNRADIAVIVRIFSQTASRHARKRHQLRTSCERWFEMTELSELDAAILRELQDNARRTNRAIADAVHVAAVDLARADPLPARARRDPRLPRRRRPRRARPRRPGPDRDPHPPAVAREHRSVPRLGASACPRLSASSSSPAATTSCSTSRSPTPTRSTPS